ISGLSLVGYVGSRWLGAGRGTVLTGLTGGLVSSTAVTLSFARQSRADGASTAATLAAGLLLAWCVMFGRVIVEVLVVHRPLVSRLLVPFAAMGVATAAAAALALRHGARRPGGTTAQPESVRLRNPFSLTEASKFAAFFAAVLLVVKLVQ